MTFGEAMIWVRGLERRYRNTLEAARLIVNTVAGALTGKTTNLKFSWDRDHESHKDDKELSPEEFAAFINSTRKP